MIGCLGAPRNYLTLVLQAVMVAIGFMIKFSLTKFLHAFVIGGLSWDNIQKNAAACLIKFTMPL